MNNKVVTGIKEFILGGKADFTIHRDAFNGKKPATFKYRVVANDNNTCWFVYAELNESGDLEHNGKNLVYQGYLKRDMSFNVGKKGVADYNKTAIDALLWVLDKGDKLPYMVHVFHHGKCSRCGRRLTDVESLRCGLGPTCRKKSVFK